MGREHLWILQAFCRTGRPWNSSELRQVSDSQSRLLLSVQRSSCRMMSFACKSTSSASTTLLVTLIHWTIKQRSIWCTLQTRQKGPKDRIISKTLAIRTQWYKYQCTTTLDIWYPCQLQYLYLARHKPNYPDRDRDVIQYIYLINLSEKADQKTDCVNLGRWLPISPRDMFASGNFPWSNSWDSSDLNGIYHPTELDGVVPK